MVESICLGFVEFISYFSDLEYSSWVVGQGWFGGWGVKSHVCIKPNYS